MGKLTLHIACELLTDSEIVKILVEGGANVNPVNNDGETLLTVLRRREDPQD